METKYVILLPIAFVCEYVDSSLGMGYGTTLTPLLLLMGFEPLQIVPAVLFSEFVTGITAAFFHHSLNNVNLNLKSQDGKVASVLSIFSGAGTIIAVFLAITLPANILKIWIGIIVLSMGVIILVTWNRQPRFTWKKIAVVGTLASFNKGLSGGGYGPLVMGGQILSGIGVKNAIGITSLAEGVTCLVGIIGYICFQSAVDWSLAPWLMAGAVISVPFAAHTVKRLTERKMKFAIAAVICVLGCLTLFKVIFHV